jgi:hypothetical protein
MIKFNFITSQAARQRSDETPQESPDRCRLLAWKTVLKFDDLELQKFHFQQAKWILLSAWIAGLTRNAGQHVTFKLPKNIEETVLLAAASFKVEAQKRRKETSFANSETHSSNGSSSSGKFGHTEQKSRASMQAGIMSEATSHILASRQPCQHFYRMPTGS